MRYQDRFGRNRFHQTARLLSVWVWLGLAFFSGGSAAFAQVRRDGDKSEPKWEVLDGCHLMTNATVDGDSFHVLYQDREFIFRLYFVDAPESDPSLKDRIAEQAADFGISPGDVLRAGELASRFTRKQLEASEFSVSFRWQNAMGRGSLPRYYGVVLVHGTNLAEVLVAHGLARIHGPRANWPDGPRSTLFVSKLKNLERIAREKRLGVWDVAAFPREGGLSKAVTNLTTVELAPKSRLDINDATYDELQKLPGIGPTLANRIIAHRPFKNIADMDRVPGIGPETIKRLEPLIHVTNSAP